MKISPVSFGQKYISSVWVKNAKTKKDEQMDFVEFEDCPKDKSELQCTAKIWDNLAPLSYAGVIYEDFIEANKENCSDKKFYGLIDNGGAIQAMAEVNEGEKELGLYDSKLPDEDVFEISFLNANPKSAADKEQREYKGLGAAMVRELVFLADKKGKEYISLNDSNYLFWHQMPYFKTQNSSQIRALKKEDFKKCINELDQTD